ncbi:MAG: hypothetical protein U0892_22180 [Pirellulales bacterium]
MTTRDNDPQSQSIDQADGLRNMRAAPGTTSSPRSSAAGPRVVLIHETPVSDAGLRWAMHLAHGLAEKSGPMSDVWFIDLAPCYSRLAGVTAGGSMPAHHRECWLELAVHGRTQRTSSPVHAEGIGTTVHAAAAESAAVSHDQLPRLYEQLLRQLRRLEPLPKWIVMMASEGRIAIDKACWLAAEDIILLSGDSPGARSISESSRLMRIDRPDASRRTWRLEKRLRRPLIDWRASRTTTLSGSHAEIERSGRVVWPADPANWSHRTGRRADAYLKSSSAVVTRQLCASTAGTEESEACADFVKFSDRKKNIQLPPTLLPINSVSEKYRA